MNLLFVVAHGDSGAYLRGLSDACRRKGVTYSVFFTGDGVRALSGSEVVTSGSGAVESVVCEHSWNQTMPDHACPLTLGSQTDHSRLLGNADRVVSL